MIDEGSIRYDHGTDDVKYYIVKAEWFWTRIAEGYAPEDDFLYKDVSAPHVRFESTQTNLFLSCSTCRVSKTSKPSNANEEIR